MNRSNGKILLPFSGQKDSVLDILKTCINYSDYQIDLIYMYGVSFRAKEKLPHELFTLLKTTCPNVDKLYYVDGHSFYKTLFNSIVEKQGEKTPITMLCTICQFSIFAILTHFIENGGYCKCLTSYFYNLPYLYMLNKRDYEELHLKSDTLVDINKFTFDTNNRCMFSYMHSFGVVPRFSENKDLFISSSYSAALEKMSLQEATIEK